MNSVRDIIPGFRSFLGVVLTPRSKSQEIDCVPPKEMDRAVSVVCRKKGCDRTQFVSRTKKPLTENTSQYLIGYHQLIPNIPIVETQFHNYCSTQKRD